jgi:hypothetical protein
MFHQTKPAFRHRHNRDCVIESICTECLVTVATASNEYGLARNEQSHVCDPHRIHHIADQVRRSISAPSSATSDPPLL